MLERTLLVALVAVGAGCAADDDLGDAGTSPADASIMADSGIDMGPAPFEPPTTLTIGTYNLQNMFDVVDDPSTDEGEFTPSAFWTVEKYLDRVERYGAALAQIDADVLAVVEVESITVLDALASATAAVGGPHYQHRSLIRGRDSRGIGVGILSVYPIVEELNRPIDLRYECTGNGGPRTLDGRSQEARPILQVDIDTTSDGVGDLVFLVSHWKSKIASAFPCDELAHRRRAALEVKGTIDMLLGAAPDRPVVALGDFNTFEFEPPLKEDMLARMDADQVVEPGHLYNTWGEFEALFEGQNANSNQWNRSTNSSYNYRGGWTRLDHIVVTGHLLMGEGTEWRLVRESTRTFNMAPLVQPNGQPAEYNPSTSMGYSDHLPVLVDLERDPLP